MEERTPKMTPSQEKLTSPKDPNWGKILEKKKKGILFISLTYQERNQTLLQETIGLQ